METEAVEVKRICQELMSTSDMVYVTTIDGEGYPQTRVMFNLWCKERFPSLSALFEEHKDELLVYLGTNTSSEKMAQIKANPAACLYFSRPEEFKGLMLSGRLEVVDDPGIKHSLWQEVWEIYYPAGPGDPDFTVLQMRPKKAKGWYEDHPFKLDLGDS